MALGMDDFDGMSEEDLKKFFEDMFMSDIAGVQGIDASRIGDSKEEIEVFEELMKMLILPHLKLGGEAGAIDSVKVLKINNPNFGRKDGKRPPRDPDADTSWLDDYLK